MLQAYRPSLDPLLAELARHLNTSDMDEISSILSEIQRRVQRFDAAQDIAQSDADA